MTQTCTISRTSTQIFSKHNYDMADEDTADKEERKREYNRLAQREFRRRRKEHLKNLEQAQKEQTSEQSGEIERLRYQNSELKRENEALKAQLYGTSMPTQILPVPQTIPSAAQQHNLQQHRSYSVSPSVSSTISGHNSPPASLAQDIMPMAALSLTSSMYPSSMPAYAEVLPMGQMQSPYSMVQHPSGATRQNPQSSQESSEFGSPRPTMGQQPFHSLSVTQAAGPSSRTPVPQRHLSNTPRPNLNVPQPYNRSQAHLTLNALFSALLTTPPPSPRTHLRTLSQLSPALPSALQPSKTQLQTPHYHRIDMLASPTLRDHLIAAGPEVAEAFLHEIDLGDTKSAAATGDGLTIWGDDPFNEMAWEFSEQVLERWGWLLGSEWVQRANYWRRQRGRSVLALPSGLGQEVWS